MKNNTYTKGERLKFLEFELQKSRYSTGQISQLQKKEHDIQLLNSIGDEYYKLSDYKKSIEFHNRVLCQTISSSSSPLSHYRLIAFRCNAENYRMLKKFKKGLNYCEQHLEIATVLQDEIEIQKAYCNMGLLYLGQAESFQEGGKHSEDIEQYINLSIDSIEKSKKRIDQILEKKTKSLQNLTLKYDANLQEPSLQSLKQIKSESLYNLANAFKVKAKWDSKYHKDSIESLQAALAYSKEIKHHIIEGKCYNTLGLIFLEKNNYPKALQCFQNDATICQVSNLIFLTIHTCITPAVYLQYAQIKNHNDEVGYIDAQINIGITYQSDHMYNEARNSFDIAKKKSKSFVEKEQEVQEKLDGLQDEINMTKKCRDLEQQLNNNNNNNNNNNKGGFKRDVLFNMRFEYCSLLQGLQHSKELIEFVTPLLLLNTSNDSKERLQFLQFKALALQELKRFTEAKQVFQELIEKQKLEYQKGGKDRKSVCADYCTNLQDFANILEELKEPLDKIEAPYFESIRVSKENDFLRILKTAYYNLDIIYETFKQKEKRSQNKKEYQKFLREHPDLLQDSGSKNAADISSSSSSLSSDLSGYDDDEYYSDENIQMESDFDQSNRSSQASLVQQKLTFNSSKRALKSKRMIQDEDEIEGEVNIRKGESAFVYVSSEPRTNVQEDTCVDTQQAGGTKNITKQNNNNKKNFFKPIIQQSSHGNNQLQTPLNLVTAPKKSNESFFEDFAGSFQKIGAQSNNKDSSNCTPAEIYKRKCSKNFLEFNAAISDMLTSGKLIYLKSMYASSLQMSPILKSLKYLSNNLSENCLIELILSQNRMDNSSLPIIRQIIKMNRRIQKLDLAFNLFQYDDQFAHVLDECSKEAAAASSSLKYLNLSGLTFAEPQVRNQDDCWERIFRIPQLEVVKLKMCRLVSLPDFFQIKLIDIPSLQRIVLKRNEIDEKYYSNMDLIWSFKSKFKFEI